MAPASLVQTASHPAPVAQPRRIEEHYRRHGVLAVLAGLHVGSDKVLIRVHHRRRHQEFLELLRALRSWWSRSRLVLVSDNLSSDTTPEVRAWVNQQSGRVRFEFIPVPASWLNPIKNGVFADHSGSFPALRVNG
jgi:hypothetical protein